MGKTVFFQGLARWFARLEMRSRLRDLGVVEPVVELSWARGGNGGFSVRDQGRVEVAVVRPVGDGRVLEVRMSKDCSYGWRVSTHGNLESARREVQGQAWYQACQQLADRAERERDEGGRRQAVERLERELGLGGNEPPE